MAPRSPRHNPYEPAIGKVLQGVQSVLAKTPPPQHIVEAIEEFERRMTDPVASRHEWKTILRRHGAQGMRDYIEEMTGLKDTWGW